MILMKPEETYMTKVTALKDSDGVTINPAKEDGGVLADIKTNTDNIPSNPVLEVLDGPDEDRLYTHPKRMLFHDTMGGSADAAVWTDTGTVDWSNATYVQLDSDEAIESVETFRYGVLTFDAWSERFDRLDYGGFSFVGTLGTDNVTFFRKNFNTTTHSSGGVSSAFAFTMANSTWYHIKIIWCPEFVSMEVFHFDGTSLGIVVQRNPSNIELPLFFRSRTNGINRLAGIRVQEADSETFYEQEAQTIQAISDSDPNLDQLVFPPTHALLQARKDASTTIGLTAKDGTFNPLHAIPSDGEFEYKASIASVNLHIENLGAAQDYVLVDLSDTTNFPHATGTGTVYITALHININPDTSFAGDVHLGFLDDVDADNGDFHPLLSWHLDRQAAEIDAFIDKVLNPYRCSPTNHLTSAISADDTGFQTDVALGSPLDNVAAFTTQPGSGDVALQVTRTAGNIDIDITLQYYVI